MFNKKVMISGVLFLASLPLLILFQNASSSSSAGLSLNSSVGSASAIRRATDFPGATAGDQILAAQKDILDRGYSTGIIDATDYNGVQAINLDLVLGDNWNTSFTLLLGRATFVVSHPIRLGRASSIQGMSMGAWSWPTAGNTPQSTVIRVADGVTLSGPIIQVGDNLGQGNGTSASISNLVIDGNASKQQSTAWIHGISVLPSAGLVDIRQVSVVQASGYGISLNANNATLSRVFVGGSVGCGLQLSGASDVFVSQSEFENNGGDGICIFNSGALRLAQSDLGGNKGAGLSAANNSSSLIINGNQFGNNAQNDLVISGGWGANVITGNQFIGSSFRASPDTLFAILINNTTNTSITGNFISTDSGANRLKAGIGLNGQITNSAGQLANSVHAVTGNTITGHLAPGNPAIFATSTATVNTTNSSATVSDPK